jgi:2-keto-4-pentenoate hydratase
MSRIDEAARLLVRARETGALLASLPESCRPDSVDEAHAIQYIAAEKLGERIAGWKVATTPEGRVARGGILRSRVFASGATISPRMTPLLGVEAEIAFRFERALPAREAAYDYAEVAAAVVAFPAIEIVDSRFHTYPKTPLLDRLADFMSNGAFVQADAIANWRGLDLVKVDVELVIDGKTIVRNVGGHRAKDPLLPVVALANDTRASIGIAAGEFATTGTYTGLNYAKPGQSVQAIFHGVGSVSVRFAEA